MVETQFGFHIIQLIDQKGALYHSRHILLRPTFSDDELMEPVRMLDSLVRLIRQDSLTFEEAALRFSEDPHSKMNGGLVSNHDFMANSQYGSAEYTQTRFTREDFGREGMKSLDDYNALRNLRVGEVSGAFRTEDMSGNQLAKIVKLLRIIPPHTASLDEDYLRVEQLALMQKQERALKEYLRARVDEMYVWIAPDLRDSEFEVGRWVKTN